MELSTYLNYYKSQVGGASPDFGPKYFVPRTYQAGRGFRSFFSSLFGYLKPILASGMSALKNTAVKVGGKVLSEVGQRPFRDIILDSGKEAISELHSKFRNKFQDGKGLFKIGSRKKKNKKTKKSTIKGVPGENSKHSSDKLRGVDKTGKKRGKKHYFNKPILDIFGKK